MKPLTSESPKEEEHSGQSDEMTEDLSLSQCLCLCTPLQRARKGSTTGSVITQEEQIVPSHHLDGSCLGQKSNKMGDIPLIIFIALNTTAHMLVSLMTTTNALRTRGWLTIYQSYGNPAMKSQRKWKQGQEKGNMQNKSGKGKKTRSLQWSGVEGSEKDRRILETYYDQSLGNQRQALKDYTSYLNRNKHF